ncbi:MAG: tyrosine-protein phosphatase [Acidimicrobiia bacterium]
MTSPPAPQLDRRVAFTRVFNVRDLGGLPTADGARIRPGQAFRGDGVHRLADEDVEVARKLGLRTVLDLRTAAEVDKRHRFPVAELGVDWHHLPLIPRQWSDDAFAATDGVEAFLTERYLHMLDTGAASIARALELVSDGVPVLFHCAAGKDRTGVMAAVLLGLAGVADEVIAEDYHLTAPAMDAMIAWLRVEFPRSSDSMTEQPPEYLACPPEAMLGFLAGVAERYGSVEGYARHLGLGDETLSALRDVLVER